MHEVQLRRNAQIIDELDVALGFADLAADMHFTRPNMVDKCVGLCGIWYVIESLLQLFVPCCQRPPPHRRSWLARVR